MDLCGVAEDASRPLNVTLATSIGRGVARNVVSPGSNFTLPPSDVDSRILKGLALPTDAATSVVKIVGIVIVLELSPDLLGVSFTNTKIYSWLTVFNITSLVTSYLNKQFRHAFVYLDTCQKRSLELRINRPVKEKLGQEGM
ncbi:uncharacterized protein LOC112588098 [Harpegnathos saltator]|uniref:uncharacterized protein LOC112588098 n=1 Tax=Harpegnathos saltator TaxID=610380 RepID=UPI000DBECF53|nr:uncharacterized protein LOC112588098 [Harpegnathos saltator]